MQVGRSQTRRPDALFLTRQAIQLLQRFEKRKRKKMSYWRPLFLQLLVLLVLKWLTSASASESAPDTVTDTKPGCRPKCGNISIPYPFGIGQGCHMQQNFFNLTCNNSKLYIGTAEDTEVLEISLQGQLSVNTSFLIYWQCYNSSGPENNDGPDMVSLYKDTPLTMSRSRNKFTAIGCDTVALIRAYWGGDSVTETAMTKDDGGRNVTETGCATSCLQDWIMPDHPCSGVGCCQTEIPPDITTFDVSMRSLENHSRVLGFNRCSYAFFIDKDHNLTASTVSDLLHSNRTDQPVPDDFKIPLAFDWKIGNQTCKEAQKNQSKFACKSKNSVCKDSTSDGSIHGHGYRCNCSEGYRGNPYLEGGGGCEDIDECFENKDNCKEKKCVNKPGKYICEPHSNSNRATVILGVILSLSCIFTVSSWIFWGVKKRKLIKLKEKHFLKNGGLLLQQQIRTHGVTVATKIFSVEELKKATNNYDENRIIGRGGYGTVYKGILSDSTVVAIKKSKIVDESQIEQFINEVFILSQIIHKNVVKLLGCCLETEVPLLVYEFIFNGTLSSHIHDEACISSLSCDTRLRIASETAEALSYLHYAAAIPIFHRDIKSTNILLDDNLTAKVSDFGASRLVPVDQTRVTTLVQGTIGYLDPEYFHTGQLTEKSDVYSFGVVLVELITGEKPTSVSRNGDNSNLAMYFLSSIRGNRLFQVLDDRVVVEGDVEQLKAIAQLAKRCLSVKGEERPTMKEVAAELERLRKFTEEPQMEREHGAILSEVGEQSEDNLDTSSMQALLMDVNG